MRHRHWALPLAAALVLASGLRADGTTHPDVARAEPPFEVSVRGNDQEHVWFTVNKDEPGRRAVPVDVVRPPSPSAGRVREIVAAPDGSFVLVAARSDPCESRLYRLWLSADGRPARIGPIGTVPALAAGLAVAPDGDRLAFATAPCTVLARDRPQAAAPDGAALTVLDTATGRRRTWTTGGPAVVGHLVWAADGRTLGYTVGSVSDLRVPVGPGKEPTARSDRRIIDAALHTLDTEAPGTDLRAARVLFQTPPNATLLRAVMNPDGRTGHGVMLRDDPPRTVQFAVDAGRRPHTTGSVPREPGKQVSYVLRAGPPRHACLIGLDAFGRTDRGTYSGGPGLYDLLPCGSADAH